MLTGQENRNMQPIGPLMIEHRLIERMVKLMKDELDRIGKYAGIDADFIDHAVDFMRTYTHLCHHGKEEKILFARLADKPLSEDLRKTMADLIQEHIFARKTVDDLEHAKGMYIIGEKGAPANIIATLNIMVQFYPEHINKEEKHFFIPCMEYFSREEMDKMLQDYVDFDSKLIHDKYRKIIKEIEEGRMMGL